MNRWIPALLLASACGLQAQEAPLDEAAGQRQRARIAAERSEVESAFQAQEKACYGKFSVTDCVGAARTRRRAALADLRRQEIALNDADRRRKAAERLRAIEDRNTLQSERDEAGGRAQALAEQQQREARAADTSTGRTAEAPAREARSAQQQARTAQAQAKREAASQRQAGERARNLRQHEERLAEAERRKAALAKRLAEKKKAPAQPLPVPP